MQNVDYDFKTASALISFFRMNQHYFLTEKIIETIKFYPFFSEG